MKYYLILIFLLLSCTSESAEENNNANSTDIIAHKIYVPEDYNEDVDLPLLIFLHGAGERGEDLDMLDIHGPPMRVKNGENFPFVIISPLCPKGSYWDDFDMQKSVKELIEKTKEDYAIDKNRIYMTGLSMGGFGTWAYAMNFPEELAAIAPICGGGKIWRTSRITDIPIWAFHGTDDAVVPYDYSTSLVDAVNEQGGNAKLTSYDNVGHLSWIEPYGTDSLYNWFLEHSKSVE